MALTNNTDEDEEFLSKCDIYESCIWLLDKLRVQEFESRPYTLPFCAYVLSWHKAIPLKCIIMGQSPYPDNVYPPIAAAMSFSTELGLMQMKKNKKTGRPGYADGVPPTVEVFANDMYINAGMRKEDTTNILKNGWALIEFGIILINEAVFTDFSSPEYYDESSDQVRVIIQMLKETEKHGKRTVDIYALGEAGQRMASDLCSWYKSPIIRLSKHSATHPAALSRRFEDLNHPDCHMATPSLSKSLAKHFSNYVAFSHIMAKKSEAELKILSYADIISGCGLKINDQMQAQESVNAIVKEISEMEDWNPAVTKEVFGRLHKATEDLIFRGKLAGSAMANAQRVGNSIAGNVSKPAPSMQNPTTTSLAQHTGKQIGSSPVVKPQKLNIIRKDRSMSESVRGPESTAGESSFDKISAPVSPPASIVSLPTSATPGKFNIIRTRAAITTPTRKPINHSTFQSMSVSSTNVTEEASDTLSQNTEKEEPKVVSSLGSHFRKLDLTRNSQILEHSGRKESQKEKDPDSQYKLSPKQKEHLGSIAAVVEAHVSDPEDADIVDELEAIQNDIQAGRIYNTRRFVDAIDEDMKKYPNFDFSDWATKDSLPSATYDMCKDVFNF